MIENDVVFNKKYRIMKKVVFFIPKLQIGGIENIFITYANKIINDYHVEFVVCKDGGELENKLSPSVTKHNLGNIQLRNSIIPLRKYIIEKVPDYVITGSDKANTILILSTRFLKNKPQIIISQHNYYNIETKKTGLLSILNQYLLRFVYPKADKIVAVSEGIKKYLCKNLKIKSSKIIVLNNPIDIRATIEQSLQKSQIDLPSEYFVFVGRLSPVKNIRFLINAFAMSQINNVKLLIVGNGPDDNKLKKYVNSLSCKDDIIFTGAVSNPLPLIKYAKVLILPSFSEAFPTVLLEALALNTKILSTPTKGALEILENCLISIISKSFDDVNDFSEELKYANNHCDICSVTFAKKYDIDIVVEKLKKEILNLS